MELESLRPTQKTIYYDELRAREYEIKKGLAEPLLVVKNGKKNILVDGHHRAIAGLNMGKTSMECNQLVLTREVELGMEKTAEKQNLHTFKDIDVSDGLSPYIVPVVLENGIIKNLISEY